MSPVKLGNKMGNIARSNRPNYLLQRGEKFYYVRRVPKDLATLVGRAMIRSTLRTDSRKEAERLAFLRNEETEARWRALRRGEVSPSVAAFRDIAIAHGAPYRDQQLLVEAPYREGVGARLELLREEGGWRHYPVAAAMLGAAPEETLLLSGCIAFYYEHNRADLQAKSPGQLKRHRNERERIFCDFVQAVGDKPLSALTREDLLSYRSELQSKVVRKFVTASTVNKYLNTLTAVLRDVSAAKGLPEPPVGRLALKNASQGQRLPYAADYIQRELLRTGALDSLNSEARRVLFVMIETGLRPSEIVNLEPGNIELGGDIPFLRICATASRGLKTSSSAREMPLVGVALAAMQEQGDGFPRYFDKADAWSAAVNKQIRALGLAPNGETAYSLRHSFEDRLIQHNGDERLRSQLMGHSYGALTGRQTYGEGWSLRRRWEVLRAIAFVSPAWV